MNREIEEATNLSKKEIEFINKKAEEIVSSEHRFLVIFGLIGALVGNIIHQTDGELDRKACLEFIKMSIEYEE